MNFIHTIILTSLIIFSNLIEAGGPHQADLRKREEKKHLELWFNAAASGKAEAILNLIGKVDINAKTNSGYTALYLAVVNGHEGIVKLLLQARDIKILDSNSHYKSILYAAIDSRHENIVKLFLGYPSLITQLKEDQEYLCLAASKKNHKILELLLQIHGININAQDKYGTALTTACQNNCVDNVKLLLEIPDINVNVQSSIGETPIGLAAFFGYEEIAKLLLKAPGINVNIRNNNGETPLMNAQNKNIAELLVEVPDIDFTIKNRSGENALKCALATGKRDIAKLIKNKIKKLNKLAFGAIKQNDVGTLKAAICQIGDNIVDGKGNTLIDQAFALNKPDIIQLLLRYAADPRELLGRFPFEFLDSSSDIFKYFVDLAYIKFCGNKQCTNTEECIQKCGRCKRVYYCSVDCQKAHWKTHKETCKAQ